MWPPQCPIRLVASSRGRSPLLRPTWGSGARTSSCTASTRPSSASTYSARSRVGRSGKLVAVTAMTPTKSGEGKTTTAVALSDGLARIGERPLACLREPSVGPVLGAKGGGTGGGRAQVVPMEDINLHFTGDLHAIAAANNLLASAVDAHLVHGNERRIDPATITWRRCLDIEDRLLRRISIGVGEGRPFPRETGFDITAASEVMALLASARDLHDLRRRLGAITVAGDRRRRAGDGRTAGGGRNDGRPAPRCRQTQSRPDAGGQPGHCPLRSIRQHRPRQQLAGCRPPRLEARRLRGDGGGIRVGPRLRETDAHRLPRRRNLPGSGRARRDHEGFEACGR